MITPPTAYPMCTIANTPRLPEHCIEWASVVQWPKLKKDAKLDTDDPDHIEWLYREASARAAEFKIEGVTWALTQGVVKNIIPAIASTNAIVAGGSMACELYKQLTSSFELQRSIQDCHNRCSVSEQLHDGEWNTVPASV